MVLPRSAMRGFSAARLLRSSVRPATRIVARRGYASGHGHSAPSSDVPWILGSAGITIPGAWYLWPDSSNGDAHGPGDAHAKQVEEHPEIEQPEEEEEEKSEDKSEEQPQEESKEESKDDESKDDESKDEPKEESKGGALKDGKGEATQEQPQSGKEPAEGESKSKRTTDGANMPENKGDVEGVSFKGPTSEGDSDNKMPDERKREPDGKGAFKKRIDSGYGKNLGEGPTHRSDGSTSAATSKTETPDDQGDIQKKQAGLSTTNTRHSTDITKDPEMSKKGEGSPDTAKSSGTISVNRPTPEAQKKQEKGEGKENTPRESKDE
ncbi:hypothetical protein D6D12_02622 [Aureobasidium pullulans]|uniref:Hypervirulence associated protein TUDOR domain-containing protein n=1 Tax=Aureobasidium pullulans TaxID=5580 RepID=A0AB74K1J5_AURPU|nr:hypothetical protein D6D12_02622 [Aureobasidium pullulans]THX64225.1 hypothetical protein D6D11_01303 [Aureobasidium pullulans]